MADKKNKGGRPATVLNDDQLAQVEALASFLTLDQIADYFCIGRTTFHRIMERQEEVSVRYKKGRTNAIGTVAKSLIQQAREGNITAQIFYLKTQGGWKEGNQLEIEVKKEQKLPSLSELFGDATETKSDTTTAN
ncbi:hypothetical protein O3795_00055 [Haemophilus parahaemolyticus]|jgi:hypothetical protein|uniref:Uncharacterized protein n=3 Tax=Haemophilus parahaemolyticus TaxID=735 RepID=A0A377I1J3_HAEPH|nr:hypothetical protein [Haemophilus parahaemolyticus]DAS15822.1 MAG TPA: DNA-binding protein [Caudoviricetes sp.]EIJ72841.1 hypothetical protein HMPREF1050_0029 [Haemophilus parahaemolyticus HK385]OOR97543.1 hypothetical protein B0185_01685 [Haemophilus parahaemolyticus]QEN11721.1 hypothetical protein E5Q53_09970 [Haemophilus parahaemolyticus]QRP12918.1 hypothetical protein I6J29_01760 [Haemophilus parahaemolyticus]